jgi:hypothetical protein
MLPQISLGIPLSAGASSMDGTMPLIDVLKQGALPGARAAAPKQRRVLELDVSLMMTADALGAATGARSKISKTAQNLRKKSPKKSPIT